MSSYLRTYPNAYIIGFEDIRLLKKKLKSLEHERDLLKQHLGYMNLDAHHGRSLVSYHFPHSRMPPNFPQSYHPLLHAANPTSQGTFPLYDAVTPPNFNAMMSPVATPISTLSKDSSPEPVIQTATSPNQTLSSPELAIQETTSHDQISEPAMQVTTSHDQISEPAMQATTSRDQISEPAMQATTHDQMIESKENVPPIPREKLKQPNIVVDQNPKLLVRSKLTTLAVRLAKVFFRDSCYV